MYDIYGKAKVTGNFGEKRSYYKPGKFHEGDDIALAMNSPINSRAAGTVIGVKNDPSGYGNYIDIDHGNGIITRYAHANKFNVKTGDVVKEGQQIGLVGSTGRSSGPHLHTELIVNGKKVNPRELNKYMANLNVLQPKGSLGVPDIRGIENLQNQIAMAQTPQGGYQLSPEEQSAKKQSLEYLLSKINTPVEIPRFTTIQDIFDAQKGDKLNVFGQYLTNNPDATRLLGSFLGGTYIDRYGRFVHGGEEEARRQEAMMQAAQERAADEIKSQENLANNMYNMAQNREIANMKDFLEREAMKQKAEQFDKQMKWNEKKYNIDNAFAREQFEENKRHNRAVEEYTREKDLKKETDKAQAKQAEIDTVYRQLDALEAAFKKLPQSRTFKGTRKAVAISSGAVNKVGLRNDDVAGFMAIRNPLTTQLARTIAGEKGVLTDKDFERASAMLPSEFDSPQQAARKLEEVKNLVNARYGINPISQTNSITEGTIIRNSKTGERLQMRNGKWQTL